IPYSPIPAFSSLAALEMHEVAVFGGVRLAEADGAGAAQMEGVAVDQQFLVADLDPGSVGGTVGEDEVALLPFDHGVIARHPIRLDGQAVALFAAEGERVRKLVDLEFAVGK